MTSILLRAPKSPFVPATVEGTLAENLIGNNSGNLIFLYASWKLLATRGTDVTAGGMGGYPDRAAAVSERYGAYVVPLANAFRVDWQASLDRMAEFIERLTIPVVVLGVGVQGSIDFTADELRPIESTVKRFVSAVLDHGPSIGVRGEITASYLEHLGFRDVEVIGCPSMFLHGERLDVGKRVPAIGRDSRLAINIGHSMASPFRAQLGSFIDRHVARYPHLVHFAQDRSTLELLVEGRVRPRTLATWPRMPMSDEHPLLSHGRVRFYIEPWPWLKDLATFDFACGSRIHGNLAALLAGTPAFVLAHDARTLELARYYEVPHLVIPDLPADADASDLHARADYGPLVRGHARRWERFVAYLDRHGLAHSFNESGDAREFDRRIASIRYPPAITAPGAPALLWRHAREAATSAARFARRAARRVGRRARRGHR